MEKLDKKTLKYFLKNKMLNTKGAKFVQEYVLSDEEKPGLFGLKIWGV